MFPNTTDHTIPARACQTDDAAGNGGDELDFDAALARPSTRKVVDLRVSGTPGEVATQMKRLSNRMLKEEGFLPIVFELTTNFRDPTIKTEFRGDTLEINQVMVYPMDFGEPIDPGQPLILSQTNLALIDLVAGPSDGEGSITNLHFECNELDWPVYEGRLQQLEDWLRANGFRVLLANVADKTDATRPKPPGRKSDQGYDRAFEQIYVEGRDRLQVYNEWLQETVRLVDLPLDPKGAFDLAMKRRRKKGGSKSPT